MAILKGKWLFNEVLTLNYDGSIYRGVIEDGTEGLFTSNGITYPVLYMYNGGMYGLVYGRGQTFPLGEDGSYQWIDEAYRTIEFIGEVTVSDETYLWFSANAVPYVQKLYTEAYIKAIADAIREHSNTSETYTVAQMPIGIEEVYSSGYNAGQEAGGGTDTSDATATAEHILEGYIAYGSEGKVTGTMPVLAEPVVNLNVVNGQVTGSIIHLTSGYLNGTMSSNSKPLADFDTNFKAENIAEGVSIFGVEGTHSGGTGADTSDATATAAQILEGYTAYGAEGKITGTIPSVGLIMRQPTAEAQVLVEAGTYCSSMVMIAGDMNFVPENIAEGKTIFGVTGTYSGGTSADTSDATAVAGDILEGKTAYTASGKVTGTIPVFEDSVYFQPVFDPCIDQEGAQPIIVPAGTYCKRDIRGINSSTLLPENIRSGTVMFGVSGSFEGYGYLDGDKEGY